MVEIGTSLRSFAEIESGKNNQRPKLQEAIELCKATGSTLIVAKIDRLTRDAAFLLNLKDAGVDFVAADMPDANRLTVGIMALIAEQERGAISKRTKDALVLLLRPEASFWGPTVSLTRQSMWGGARGRQKRLSGRLTRGLKSSANAP